MNKQDKIYLSAADCVLRKIGAGAKGTVTIDFSDPSMVNRHTLYANWFIWHLNYDHSIVPYKQFSRFSDYGFIAFACTDVAFDLDRSVGSKPILEWIRGNSATNKYQGAHISSVDDAIARSVLVRTSAGGSGEIAFRNAPVAKLFMDHFPHAEYLK